MRAFACCKCKAIRKPYTFKREDMQLHGCWDCWKKRLSSPRELLANSGAFLLTYYVRLALPVVSLGVEAIALGGLEV